MTATIAHSEKGVTMLEMLVASLVFMLFVGGVMGIWGSLEKQRMHVQARARLDSEAQLARTQMVVDISSAENVASLTGQDLTITYPDSSVVTYSPGPDNQLLRYESATISTTTAALYLSNVSTSASNGATHWRLNFSRKPFPASSTTLTSAVDLWWKSI